MSQQQPEDLPNKLIGGGRARRLSTTDEIKEARSSPAYWWYRALQLNDEYEYCCQHSGRGTLSATYRDFGDVFNLDFAQWWIRHGRKIFTETKPFKKTRQIVSKAELETVAWDPANKLILEIPLSLKRQTAMRQVGRLIKKAYEGREVDVFKASTARRMIIKSKMRMTTVATLIRVLETRKQNPTLKLWEIGEKSGIELDLMARNKDEFPTLAMERRRMTIAVSRLVRQATYLVVNAGYGRFPSIQKPETGSVV